MTNKNYKKGRRKEYKIVQQLRKEGYDIVQRSAGSHSPVDVWAVRKRDRRIIMIQSKPSNLSQGAKNKILQEFEWLNGRLGEYRVEFLLV